MPVVPNFHIEHICSLALQIKRAPQAVRISQLEKSEKLVSEITENQLYPLDYVVYRITRYRDERPNQPMLLGSALLGDLVALIAVVSRTLDISAIGTMTIKEVTKRLNVSQRTINRLRKEGLVFRWVKEANGTRRLGCSEQALELFRDSNKKRLETAAKFTRLTKSEQQAIVKLAMQYRGSGKSLNDVAKELSNKSERGHETIRMLLQSVDQTNKELSKPPPLSRQKVRAIEKEIQAGIPWTTLASRHHRSVGALRKSLARLRATRLSQLEIHHVELDIFNREDAENVILGSPIVQQLRPPVLSINPLEFGSLELERSNSDEIAIVSAMHLLRRRASIQSNKLSYSPRETSLDRIETDLLWAYLLQQELMMMSFRSSLAVAVQHAGRPLHELTSSRITSLVREVINVVGTECGKLDPTKGQKTISTPSSVLDRELSSNEIIISPSRAAARHKTPTIECPFHEVVQWSYLIPRVDLPLIAKKTSDELSELVSLKFGWSGRPRTVDEISILLNRSRNWVSRQLRNVNVKRSLD
ncbi:MAG: hypothetical protein QF718_06450 [Phycisphaerales bacterium]|jgi:DNA-binding transcriptional MerR regulator|nr:hypothetical protein [Phycisphaerales bacterium]